jgi:hypothetical protein
MSGRKGHPQEVKDRIRSLYQSNVSIPEIHRETGVHKNTIRSIVGHTKSFKPNIVEEDGIYFDIYKYIKSDFTLQP